MFDRYLERWGLVVDGESIVTQFSMLLPVRYRNFPAMLKILLHDEERTGSDLLTWWAGEGAVRMLERHGDGLLLERATGSRSLATLAKEGQDEQATRILCDVAALLHAPRASPPPSNLPTLEQWFSPLVAARDLGELLEIAQSYAARLLADQQDVAVLHGDLHHNNVLDAGERGWLAIDPKGIIGERAFDFVNILRNPIHHFGADPVRLWRQVELISQTSDIDPIRLLEWTAAFCGLSVAWIRTTDSETDRDRQEATSDLAILETAHMLLNNYTSHP